MAVVAVCGRGIDARAQVGDGAHVGPNASVREECRLGQWCVIAMGAVVIRDVPDYANVEHTSNRGRWPEVRIIP